MNVPLRLIPILALLLTGCVTVKLHDGSIPETKTSTLTEQVFFGVPFVSKSLDIVKIDQTKISEVFAYRFEMLPGKHQIDAVLQVTFWPVPGIYIISQKYACDPLTFESKAGHDYKLQFGGWYNDDGKSKHLWSQIIFPWVEIEDLSTGTVSDRQLCRELE